MIVDTALRERQDKRQPIRVGLVGAGATGPRHRFAAWNASPRDSPRSDSEPDRGER